jgi:hypothetical protein
VDALEALDDDGAHAEQVGALRRPVARGAGAIFLAGDDDHRRAVGLVLHRHVIDRHDFIAIAAHAALDAGDHLVLDADVGEGAAHHHLMMAAARAIGVEVRLAT